MRIAVVYESLYGNTAAVAQAVAEGLRSFGDVDFRAIGEEPTEADMLVGAPTLAHGLPSSMTRKKILTGSAAKTMAHNLGHRGYRMVAEPESFLVMETEGPLKEGELDRARQRGASLDAGRDTTRR